MQDPAPSARRVEPEIEQYVPPLATEYVFRPEPDEPVEDSEIVEPTKVEVVTEGDNEIDCASAV